RIAVLARRHGVAQAALDALRSGGLVGQAERLARQEHARRRGRARQRGPGPAADLLQAAGDQREIAARPRGGRDHPIADLAAGVEPDREIRGGEGELLEASVERGEASDASGERRGPRDAGGLAIEADRLAIEERRGDAGEVSTAGANV